MARLLQRFCHYLPLGGGLLAHKLWPRMVKGGLLPTRTWLGFIMRLDFENGDHLNWWLGRYERPTTSLLSRLLEPGDLFIDVGANAGYYSLLAGRCVGIAGRVIAFEPEPSIYANLCANVKMNGLTNTETKPMALADKAGRMTLISRPNGGNSMLRLERSQITRGGRDKDVSVDVSTLDEECLKLLKSWPGRRILKIDAEGAEPAILAGAAASLPLFDAAVVEINPLLLGQMGHRPSDVMNAFLDAGFSAAEIPVRRGQPRPVERDYCDNANVFFFR